MKAILRTRCGCTRMIDMVSQVPEIRMPLKPGYTNSLYSTNAQEHVEKVEHRRFQLMGQVDPVTSSLECWLYEEIGE